MLTTFAVLAASVSLGGSIRGMVASAGLAEVGIAGGGFAVQRQTQDLAFGLVWILSGREPLAVANREEQILVRRARKRSAPPSWPPLPLGI